MVTLSPTTRFVGVEDDNLDLFEGQYPLPKGVSYNSYLISTAEKVAVIDAVDRRRCDDWLDNLANTLGGSTPDYLVIQHVEPDHSGSIDMFLKQYPSARVVATAKAVEMLGNFFEDVDFASRSIVVKDGDTLDLGGVTLEFVTAPMGPWPEGVADPQYHRGHTLLGRRLRVVCHVLVDRCVGRRGPSLLLQHRGQIRRERAKPA